MQYKLLEKALSCIENREFYEAHELFESIWKIFDKNQKYERNCTQGLVRVCIALYHYKEGRLDSALKVLKIARNQLLDCEDCFLTINLKLLLEELNKIEERMKDRKDIFLSIVRC